MRRPRPDALLDWREFDRPRPVHANPSPQVLDTPTLRLESALQLLDQSGHVLPELGDVGRAAWLQAVVDALCDLSSQDPLTGLANRRHFELALEREIDRVERVGEPALVLMVDIDHFKKVNDSHGHAVGDLVLRSVAQVLQACIRPMDMVSRIGGEEFAIILPNCPLDFGHTAAERVRAKVQHGSVMIAAGVEISVTVSVGGAFALQWGRTSAQDWLSQADQQLYLAKRQGRNSVRLLEPAQVPTEAKTQPALFDSSWVQDVK